MNPSFRNMGSHFGETFFFHKNFSSRSAGMFLFIKGMRNIFRDCRKRFDDSAYLEKTEVELMRYGRALFSKE